MLHLGAPLRAHGPEPFQPLPDLGLLLRGKGLVGLEAGPELLPLLGREPLKALPGARGLLVSACRGGSDRKRQGGNQPDHLSPPISSRWATSSTSSGVSTAPTEATTS